MDSGSHASWGTTVGKTRRLANLAQTPTVAEAGIPGYEVALWMGVFMPAGTPAQVVDLIGRELNAAIASREVGDLLASHGIEPEPGGAQRLAALVASEVAKWRKVAVAAGIEPH